MYLDTFHAQTATHEDDRFWLGIFESLPARDPRQWHYEAMGVPPVSWFNWKDGEPNNHGKTGKGDGYEPKVEVDSDGFWNDVDNLTKHKFLCVYYLPVGAENTCPWLSRYQSTNHAL